MEKCFILVSVRKGAQQHRNTPYLFNAKEFDEEAGLYFYSRDPKINKWNGGRKNGCWKNLDEDYEKFFDRI